MIGLCHAPQRWYNKENEVYRSEIKGDQMYQLLLVTDQKNLLRLFESFTDWQALGFAPPLLYNDVHEAMQMVSQGEVDAVSYALPKDSGQAFYHFMTGYPKVCGMEAASDLPRLRRAVSGLRRQLREREQAPEEMQGDVLGLLQMEFFHTLMGGARMAPEKLENRVRALKLQIETESPLAVAHMRMPHGQVYIDQVWRYGRDRLKVALHNFFDRELPQGRFVLDVMSLSEIKLMFCPREPMGEQAMLDLFYDHLTRAREEVKQYLDLGMQVTRVLVYDDLWQMTRGDAGRILYETEE